jgi:thiol-disulfide isomerase/thioredoxin
MLQSLRANGGHKMTLVSVWGPQCAACLALLPAMEETHRMYGTRGVELITIAAGAADEAKKEVERLHINGRNFFACAGDAVTMEHVIDPEWDGSLPYTAVIARDGRLVYRKMGSIESLELRQTILANIEWEYVGFSRY